MLSPVYISEKEADSITGYNQNSISNIFAPSMGRRAGIDEITVKNSEDELCGEKMFDLLWLGDKVEYFLVFTEAEKYTFKK